VGGRKTPPSKLRRGKKKNGGCNTKIDRAECEGKRRAGTKLFWMPKKDDKRRIKATHLLQIDKGATQMGGAGFHPCS